MVIMGQKARRRKNRAQGREDILATIPKSLTDSMGLRIQELREAEKVIALPSGLKDKVKAAYLKQTCSSVYEP